MYIILIFYYEYLNKLSSLLLWIKILYFKWIATEYLPSREIEKNNCFMYSLSDLNNTFCDLLCVFWCSIFLDFQYFRFTNGGETRVYTGHFVLFGSRIIHSVGSEYRSITPR